VAVEMGLAALLEDLGSIFLAPTTQLTTVCTSSSRGPGILTQTHMQEELQCTQNKNKLKTLKTLNGSAKIKT